MENLTTSLHGVLAGSRTNERVCATIWKTASDVLCHVDDTQSAEETSRNGNQDITSWGGNEDGNGGFLALISCSARACSALANEERSRKSGVENELRSVCPTVVLRTCGAGEL